MDFSVPFMNTGGTNSYSCYMNYKKTYHRSLYPFKIIGIGILFVRPKKNVPFVFSFLSPLSVTVWMSCIAAHIVVTISLFLIAKISLHEKICPAKKADRDIKEVTPCSSSDRQNNIQDLREPRTPVEQITLAKAFWFILASLLQQGSDLSQKYKHNNYLHMSNRSLVTFK